MNKSGATSLFFGICAGLFLFHQVLQKMMGINIQWMDDYLDPLLAMPILLHLVTIERRLLVRDALYLLPQMQVIGLFMAISIAGELVFPVLSDEFTADAIDALFYGAGAMLHLLFGRSSRKAIRCSAQSLA